MIPEERYPIERGFDSDSNKIMYFFKVIQLKQFSFMLDFRQSFQSGFVILLQAEIEWRETSPFRIGKLQMTLELPHGSSTEDV